MKIAVTYEEGKVFQHFGHTEHFKFYEVEDGKVTTSQVVDTDMERLQDCLRSIKWMF